MTLPIKQPPWTITNAHYSLRPLLDVIWDTTHNHKQNMFVTSTGDPGSGKSVSDMALTWATDRDEKGNLLFSIDDYYFNPSEFLDALGKPCHPGKSMILDEGEFSVNSKETFNVTNLILEKTMSSIRFQRQFIQINLPSEIMLARQIRNLRDLNLEFEGVNDVQGFARMKAHILKIPKRADSSSKIDNDTTRMCLTSNEVIDPDLNIKLTTRWIGYKLYKPTSLDFRSLERKYERKKREHLRMVYTEFQNMYRKLSTAMVGNISKKEIGLIDVINNIKSNQKDFILNDGEYDMLKIRNKYNLSVTDAKQAVKYLTEIIYHD